MPFAINTPTLTNHYQMMHISNLFSKLNFVCGFEATLGAELGAVADDDISCSHLWNF